MTCRLRLSILVIAIVCLVWVGSSPAATNEVVIHSFQPDLHGYAGYIIADTAGNFYGASGGGSYNAGLVYRLTPKAQGDWTETVLYEFTGGSDGGNPSSLYWDGKNFYGLAGSGGQFSYGVFFELTPRSNGTWSEKVLYNFPNPNDGLFNPGIARDAVGNFYGTTWNWNGPVYGSLFQLVPAAGGLWTENILHEFSNGADGGTPLVAPILDSAGNLYGTTAEGGADNLGVVFEFSPSGQGNWSETVLYNFASKTDGYEAQWLVFDQGGGLIGTTIYGGAPQCSASGGCGTIFEFKASRQRDLGKKHAAQFR